MITTDIRFNSWPKKRPSAPAKTAPKLRRGMCWPNLMVKLLRTYIQIGKCILVTIVLYGIELHRHDQSYHCHAHHHDLHNHCHRSSGRPLDKNDKQTPNTTRNGAGTIFSIIRACAGFSTLTLDLTAIIEKFNQHMLSRRPFVLNFVTGMDKQMNLYFCMCKCEYVCMCRKIPMCVWCEWSLCVYVRGINVNHTHDYMCILDIYICTFT